MTFAISTIKHKFLTRKNMDGIDEFPTIVVSYLPLMIFVTRFMKYISEALV